MQGFYKSRLVLTCVTLVLLAGALAVSFAVTPKQASASGYGWDYISLPTWAGNCPAGGSVKFMQIMVGNTWSGGDYGDDLVYAKVVLGQDQSVVGQGFCYNGSRSYPGTPFTQTIHPTRSDQTWWVGPYGVWHNYR
jgi:hypothetical protein